MTAKRIVILYGSRPDHTLASETATVDFTAGPLADTYTITTRRRGSAVLEQTTVSTDHASAEYARLLDAGYRPRRRSGRPQ